VSLAAEPRPPAEALVAIRAPFEAFGGEWADAPVLQPLDLLLDLAGEAMRARLVVVQGEGGDEMCLRPDFTIPIARAHIDSGRIGGRYLYEDKAFRAAPQGSGRAAEFLQIGAEVYGAGDGIGQEAEISALAWRAAEAGGRRDLSLMLGDIALFAAFLQVLGAPDVITTRLLRAFASGRKLRAELERAQSPIPPSVGGRLADLLGDLPEAEAAGVLEELWSLAGVQPVGGRAPAEIVHRLGLRAEAARAPRLTPAEAGLISRYLEIADTPRGALEQVEALAYEAKAEFDVQLRPWIARLKALSDAGVPEAAMTLCTGFVRPFGYYDGLLFEVRSAALGSDRPVAAGGRYDGLPARLGGAAGAGAVGCMVRPARAWAGGVS
jgi:ATP phosphoribosyltransferase regulatory subunit